MLRLARLCSLDHARRDAEGGHVTHSSARSHGGGGGGGGASARHGLFSRSIAHRITNTLRPSATIAIYFLSFMPRLSRATKLFAQAL